MLDFVYFSKLSGPWSFLRAYVLGQKRFSTIVVVGGRRVKTGLPVEEGTLFN